MHDSRGVSNVISTLIISGVLLVILVMASFVSANILELQIASTEFEQGKTNMALLDEVIQDVALRRGSGGYVQFNQRTGGIGVTQHADCILIYAGGRLIYNSTPLVTLDYRGSSYASSMSTIIKGNDSLIVQGSNASPSYLRVETNNGLWTRLDYERVRIMQMGMIVVNGTVHNFIGLTFIRLERGSMGGSDTVNVQAQNVGTNTTSYIYDSGDITIQVKMGSRTATSSFSSSAKKSVVILTEVHVKVSTT
jgi:hypothetical protein